MAPLFQPDFDGLHNTIHFPFTFLRQLQEMGQGEITSLQSGFVRCIDPQNAAVDVGITTVSVFEGKLCFANTP